MAQGIIHDTKQMPATVRKPIDLLLFSAVLLLVMIGLWMVFDTSYAKAMDENRAPWHYLLRQATIGGAGGFLALLTFWRIGYWKLHRVAIIGMLVGIVLLCLVWIPPLGVNLNNANRWIQIPKTSFQFQPSELGKLLLIFYLARIFARKKGQEMSSFQEHILPPLMVILAYIVLIEREPDLGTAVVVFLTSMTMLFMAGAKKRHILAILLTLVTVAGIFAFGFSHRGNRLKAFLYPELDPKGIGYQVKMSREAVGSGGWKGVGIGQGRGKYYLPQRDTDFIYATLAEETGFVGCITVLTLLTFVGLRGWHIAKQAQDPFARQIAIGISSMILWQAFINIGVVTTAIPATGVPLPFISFGSSSLLILMAGMGVLLSIAQYPLPPQRAVKEAPPKTKKAVKEQSV
jgi:cell division protein FtsW